MGNNYQVDFFYNKIKNYKDIEDDIWKIINMYFGHVRNFKIQRKIQWILVNSLSSKNLSQGWKIHISATRFTAIEILTSVSQIILKDNVTFNSGVKSGFGSPFLPSLSFSLGAFSASIRAFLTFSSIDLASIISLALAAVAFTIE